MYKLDFDHPSSIYFVGIGGISMSGLAEILLACAVWQSCWQTRDSVSPGPTALPVR